MQKPHDDQPSNHLPIIYQPFTTVDPHILLAIFCKQTKWQTKLKWQKKNADNKKWQKNDN